MAETPNGSASSPGTGALALYIGAALAASAISFFLIFNFSKSVYREAGMMHDRHYEMLSTASSLVTLDSALTLAAREGAVTASPGHIKQHENLACKLDAAVKRINRLTVNPEGSPHAGEINEANLKLEELERKALQLAGAGKNREAGALLSGREYLELKKEYATAVNELLREFEISLKKEGFEVRGAIFKTSLAVTVSVCLTLLFWGLTAVSARRWLRLRGSTEELVARKEAEFRHFFDSVQEIFYRANWKGELTDITPSVTRYSGYTSEELLGRPVSTLYNNPEDRKALIAELLSKGMIEDYELKLKTKDRGVLDVLVNARLLRGVGGLPAGIEGSLRDITARKATENSLRRMNRIYAILSLVNEAIMHVSTPQKLYEEICRIAVENGGVKFAWVGLTGSNGLIKPAASFGQGADYLHDIRISTDFTLPEGRGPSGTAFREGRVMVNSDTENNLFMLPWKYAALKHGFRSSATFPVAGIGVVIFYSEETGFFAKEDERLLASLAESVTYAVNSMNKAA